MEEVLGIKKMLFFFFYFREGKIWEDIIKDFSKAFNALRDFNGIHVGASLY